MKLSKSLDSMAPRLQKVLAPKFSGIRVEVEPTSRWNRPCVTFTCADFAGLLPEERFHRLVSVIPADFREEQMAGLVWVELAEGETLDAFLKLPRSEDIVRREKEIYERLCKVNLFDALSNQMGGSPDKHCKGDFAEMTKILSKAKSPPDGIRDAKLLMIRHRAYCDCQVLLTAGPELESQLGGN